MPCKDWNCAGECWKHPILIIRDENKLFFFFGGAKGLHLAVCSADVVFPPCCLRLPTTHSRNSFTTKAGRNLGNYPFLVIFYCPGRGKHCYILRISFFLPFSSWAGHFCQNGFHPELFTSLSSFEEGEHPELAVFFARSWINPAENHHFLFYFLFFFFPQVLNVQKWEQRREGRFNW